MFLGPVEFTASSNIELEGAGGIVCGIDAADLGMS